MIGQRRWHERGFTRAGWCLNDDVSGVGKRIDGLGYGQPRANAGEIEHLLRGPKTFHGAVQFLALPRFLIAVQRAHHAAGRAQDQ